MSAKGSCEQPRDLREKEGDSTDVHQRKTGVIFRIGWF